MESIKKNIFMPVNGTQSKSKYLCLLMESIKKRIFVPVNRLNQKVNICAC